MKRVASLFGICAVAFAGRGAAAEGPRPAEVELREAGVALVRGERVVFDGLAEGLAWPALDAALGHRRAGSGPVTIRASRTLPTLHLLRAAWTLRGNDVRVESEKPDGAIASVTFDARPAGPQGPATGCHLAAFVQPDGAIRVAAPGGAATVGDTAILARSLAAARESCPLRYVAVGAESDGAPWGSVFDLALALEASGAAGKARKVLGQALPPR